MRASSVRNTSTNSCCSRSRPPARATSRPWSIARLASAVGDDRAPARARRPTRARRRATHRRRPGRRARSRRASSAPTCASRVDQVLGPRRPDQPGEPLGAAAAGDDAEQDLGLTEPRRRRRHPEVAGEGELAAAAEGEAGDGGDRRPRDGGHGVEGVAGRRRPTTAASSGPPNSPMSAPAANIRSEPVTTTAPGGSSVRSPRRRPAARAAARSTGR